MCTSRLKYTFVVTIKMRNLDRTLHLYCINSICLSYLSSSIKLLVKMSSRSKGKNVFLFKKTTSTLNIWARLWKIIINPYDKIIYNHMSQLLTYWNVFKQNVTLVSYNQMRLLFIWLRSYDCLWSPLTSSFTKVRQKSIFFKSRKWLNSYTTVTRHC